MKKIYERIKNMDLLSKKAFTVMYSIAISCIMIISISQVGLRNASTRRFFTKIDTYEGAYFEATAEIPADDVHTIEINVSSDCVENGEILVNGETYCELVNGKNEINIDDTSVIEIYSPKGKTEAQITYMSDGLVLYTKSKKTVVSHGLNFLGRVGIK